MSTIVLITAGKGFAISAALEPTPSPPQHRPFRRLLFTSPQINFYSHESEDCLLEIN